MKSIYKLLVIYYLMSISQIATSQNNIFFNIDQSRSDSTTFKAGDTIKLCDTSNVLILNTNCIHCFNNSKYFIVDNGNGVIKNHKFGETIPVYNYTTNSIYKVKVSFVIDGLIRAVDSIFIDYQKNCINKNLIYYEDINGNCIKDTGEIIVNSILANPETTIRYQSTNNYSSTISRNFFFKLHPNDLISNILLSDTTYYLSSFSSSCPVNFNPSNVELPTYRLNANPLSMDTSKIIVYRDKNKNCIKDTSEQIIEFFGLNITDLNKGTTITLNNSIFNYSLLAYLPKTSSNFKINYVDQYNVLMHLPIGCNNILNKNTIQYIPVLDTCIYSLEFDNINPKNLEVGVSTAFKTYSYKYGACDSSYIVFSASNGFYQKFDTLPSLVYITFSQKGKYQIKVESFINNILSSSITDSVQVSDTAYIYGKYYLDSNNNCLLDSGELIFKKNINLPNITTHRYNFYNYYTNVSSIGNSLSEHIDENGDFSDKVLIDSFNRYTFFLSSNINSYNIDIYKYFFGCGSTTFDNAYDFLILDKVTNLNVPVQNVPSILNFLDNFIPDSNYICSKDSIEIPLNITKSYGNMKTLIDWGDGSKDSLFHYISDIEFSKTLKHRFNSSGLQNVTIYFYDINSELLKSVSDSIMVYECGNVEGIVYLDQNNNCSFDSNIDKRLKGYQLQFLNNSILKRQLFTDNYGLFNVALDSSLNYFINAKQKVNCGNNSNQTPMIPWNGQSALFQNIPISPDSIDFSLFCYWEGRPVPNNIIEINLGYSSITSATNDIYEIMLPSKTQYIQTLGGIGTQINPNKIEVVANNQLTNNYNSTSSKVYIKLDSTLKINDTLCFELRLKKNGNEADTINNFQKLCFTVRTSYDPNDKQVNIKSLQSNGDFNDKTDEFIYTIRFQNTGNAEAENLYILDPIDTNFDIKTFRFISSSHNPILNISEDNIIKFNFRSIWLPDSFSNEPASHGNIIYGIKPNTNLKLNSTVKNTAYIYFDFNEPIITNTTSNKFVEKKSNNIDNNKNLTNQISIFPNPVKGNYLHIGSRDYSNLHSFKIFSIFGKDLKKGIFNGQFKVNISDLSKGIYYIEINDKNGICLIRQKIIVEQND